MPMFFFKFQTGKSLTEDSSGGIDLPNLDAARVEAMQAAREIVSEAVKYGSVTLPDSIVICDDAGRKLSIIPLADTLPPSLKR